MNLHAGHRRLARVLSRASDAGMISSWIAFRTGVSEGTARRYLADLRARGLVDRTLAYGMGFYVLTPEGRRWYRAEAKR